MKEFAIYDSQWQNIWTGQNASPCMVHSVNALMSIIGPEVIKTFFMLNSAETKIYPAHKHLNANIYEQDNFLSFEFEFSTNFDYFNIYEQLKFHAQLNSA